MIGGNKVSIPDMKTEHMPSTIPDGIDGISKTIEKTKCGNKYESILLNIYATPSIMQIVEYNNVTKDDDLKIKCTEEEESTRYLKNNITNLEKLCTLSSDLL
jgi:hypothetical protein